MHPQAADWWGEAEADLAGAQTLLEGGHFNNAVFLARQAVEKALKACHLALKREAPPLTHGLRTMARDVFGDVPDDIWLALGSLDPEYTATRYPSAVFRRPSQAYARVDADRAIQSAREVLRWLSDRLSETS